jgi:hypothetical protein
MVEKENQEDWMQKRWRPAMGWMYMIICIFDMVLFPILWAIIQTIDHQSLTQWNPLTLQGGGLFHIAMGAVLGIAAFGRTQEKLAGSATNVTPTTTTISTPAFGATMPTTPSIPAPVFPTQSFGTPPAPAAGFGTGFPGDPPTRNTRNDL